MVGSVNKNSVGLNQNRFEVRLFGGSIFMDETEVREVRGSVFMGGNLKKITLHSKVRGSVFRRLEVWFYGMKLCSKFGFKGRT